MDMELEYKIQFTLQCFPEQVIQKHLFSSQCGSVWVSVGQCGSVWVSVGQCGSVWVSVGQCGSVWASVGQCGPVWVSVGQCGSIATPFRVWEVQGHYGPDT